MTLWQRIKFVCAAVAAGPRTLDGRLTDVEHNVEKIQETLRQLDEAAKKVALELEQLRSRPSS